jgi:hypothetical protein
MTIADSPGRRMFLDQLAQSPLPDLLRPFDAESRVVAVLTADGGLISGADMFLAASATTRSGTRTHLSASEIREIERASDQLVLRVPPSRPELVGHLRSVRGLRPAWFSAPIYARLLDRFVGDITKIVGLSAAELFELVIEVTRLSNDSTFDFARFRGLPEDLVIDAGNIGEPADLLDRAFLRVGERVFPLSHQIADAIYRALCNELSKSVPKFLDKKGDALEELTYSVLSRKAPSWRWLRNFESVSKSPAERDLLGTTVRAGLCAESKCLGLRKSSRDWSAKNADSDLEPLRSALDQLELSMELLEHGGMVTIKGSTHHVPPVASRFGLVVTDEVYTPYLRAYLDPPASGSLDLHPDAWHGSKALVLSILDLSFLLECSGTISCFLDFCAWSSRRPRLRTLDTPEAWLFYCVDPMVRFSMMGAQVFAEFDYWNDLRDCGFSELRPPWLADSVGIARRDSSGNINGARRELARERDLARRHHTDSRFKESLTTFWRNHIALLDRGAWRVTERSNTHPADQRIP